MIFFPDHGFWSNDLSKILLFHKNLLFWFLPVLQTGFWLIILFE